MLILIDSREQKPFRFKDYDCEVRKLETGDYTLAGYEDVLAIERKANASELYGNIVGQDRLRFIRELERLRTYKYAYVIVCCSLNDILSYPYTSKLSPAIKKKIGNRGPYFLKRLTELMFEFPSTHWVFAGSEFDATKLTIEIFKNVSKTGATCNTAPN